MPLDLHRRRHRGEPLVLLVLYPDDDVTGICFCQPACANLSRQGACHLYGRVNALEFNALVIVHERRPGLDIEIVTGHSTPPCWPAHGLLWSSSDASAPSRTRLPGPFRPSVSHPRRAMFSAAF